TPCRASHRHSPATSTLLPASEPVPATSSVPRTDAGYCASPGGRPPGPPAPWGGPPPPTPPPCPPGRTGPIRRRIRSSRAVVDRRRGAGYLPGRLLPPPVNPAISTARAVADTVTAL